MDIKYIESITENRKKKEEGNKPMMILRKEMKELNKQYRETDRIYHEISTKAGLSDIAFMILYAITEMGDGCQQKDIADIYLFSRQTINSSILGLQRKGILQLNKGSGRDLHISLTEKGQQFVEEKIYPVMELENSVFDELTEQESEVYLHLMQKTTRLLRDKVKEL